MTFHAWSSAARMTMRRRSLPLLVVLYCCCDTVSANHVYTDSFPTNDEYDFNILDPLHIFGSPYGGFGRATRSRLASLPLHLPGTVGKHTDPAEEFYLQVRDGDGRLFACRVYHEDELVASSLDESMFTTVKLNDLSSSDEDKVVSSDDVEESVTVEEETGQKDAAEDDALLDSELGRVLAVNKVLAKLDGVCTQIHKGWWSYEWCHGNKVTQFHVHVERGAAQQIQLDSVTNLGGYSTSAIYTDGDPVQALQDKKSRKIPEKQKQEEKDTEEEPKELAVVVHEFEHGDMCPETEQPRRTQVKLKCCSLKKMNRLKRAVLFHGEPVASNIAAITKMQETSVCNYSIEVCTPLLCEGLAEAFDDGLVAKEAPNDNSNLIPTPLTSRKRKEKESIREILEGTLKNVCLRFFNGGWWVYEVCHGRHVRQFHETDNFDPKSGSYSRVPESIHMLGSYSKEDLEGFPNEDEPKYVTNPSGDKDQEAGMKKTAGIKDDVGAYFVQEYTHGDVCDHSDVTDAAIKAGNVGEGGIERATTVRYFCGEKFEMLRVNEDSTCHYVMDITVPDLCEHKLFQAPVAKKQVIKCLHIDESQASIT